MLTPKHFTAMAASKNTAALGNVICDTAKNDACRCGAFVAHTDSKCRPNAATAPLNMHVNMPGIKPDEAIAWYHHEY